MDKDFNELSKISVKITKKPTFKFNKATQSYEEVKGKEIDTLSWADCLQTLYDNGAKKIIFENIPNEKGGLLYIDENGSSHIKVFVEIDGDRREIFYPLIDGNKNVSLEKINQSDIYNAKQRAFVKCVAVNWGLGLYLWQKEFDPDMVAKEETTPSVFEYFRNMVNTATKKCGSVSIMLEQLNGVTEKQIKELIKSAQEIDAIQRTLEKVLSNDKKS